MVLAPMKGVVTMFLLFGFAILWRYLLPCLVFLLIRFVLEHGLGINPKQDITLTDHWLEELGERQ